MTLQQLRRATEHPSFRAGVIDMSGTAVGIAAWALVTGVAMVKAGISAPIRTPRGRDIMAACGQLKSAATKPTRAELDRIAEEKQAALG